MCLPLENRVLPALSLEYLESLVHYNLFWSLVCSWLGVIPTIQVPSPMPVIVIFFDSDGTDVYPSASDTVSGVVVVIEAPKEQVEKATEWLKRCMEEGMGEFLREVPVAVDISVKDSWG